MSNSDRNCTTAFLTVLIGYLPTTPHQGSDKKTRILSSDACRLAQRRDALICRRALFEPGEWVRPPASLHLNKTRRDVNGFGSFCLHNKGCAPRDAPSKTSPAGAKPGNTEHHVATNVRSTSVVRAPTSALRRVFKSQLLGAPPRATC